MAGITFEQANAKLQMWLDAEEVIAERGQKYVMPDGRQLDRPDLGEIRESITYWDEKTKSLDPNTQSSIVKLGVPRI